jgi:hypothetical protein
VLGAVSQAIEIRNRDDREVLRGRLFPQPQHQPRDHPERALGADEDLLEVVAGIVLDQVIHR